jgi:hypothetical protein
VSRDATTVVGATDEAECIRISLPPFSLEPLLKRPMSMLAGALVRELCSRPFGIPEFLNREILQTVAILQNSVPDLMYHLMKCHCFGFGASLRPAEVQGV